MAELRQLTEADFNNVYEEFLRDDDPVSCREDWLRLFRVPWRPVDDCRGYALYDKQQVVGMLGMIISERTIAGRQLRLCNLHSWFVRTPYRGQSLLLMRPALGRRDHILTDFTPTRQVREINSRLGFQPLASSLQVLFPAAVSDSPGAKHYRFVEEPEEISRIVSPSDRRLLEDQSGRHLKHLLASGAGGYCYVIYSRVTRHWMSYAHVHHVSEPRLFAELHASFRRILRRKACAYFVAVEARRFDGWTIPCSRVIPAGNSQMVRFGAAEGATSESILRGIDTLYSEVSELNLTTFPSLKSCVKRFSSPEGRVARVKRGHRLRSGDERT